MYRLFIDIPIRSVSNEDAVERAQHLVNALLLSDDAKVDLDAMGVKQINYRLGHDEDRQKSNYFIIDDKGHCSNKKCKVNLKEE